MKPTLNLLMRHDLNMKPFFQVDTVKNTVRWLPGDILEKEEVEKIVNSKNTNVNIKEGPQV